MVARFHSWWQQIKTHPGATVLIALFVTLVVLVILGGYKFNWGWTGFNRDNKSSKTLWDWMQLLFIPVVLAIAGFWFNHNERKATEKHADIEREISSDNQREVAIQAYIDKISELLLHANLRKPVKEEEVDTGELHLDEVRIIARVRTLTVLSELDGRRKGDLIKFLHEADLINNDLKSIIFLDDADLSGADLKKANLKYANLRVTNLSGANLSQAVLSTAILVGADLSKANLQKATLIKAQLGIARQWISTGPDFVEGRMRKTRLSGADLTEAHLFEADLSDADLSGANLCGAYLERANLDRADLTRANLKDVTGITVEELERQASSLKGATMPDGSIHT